MITTSITKARNRDLDEIMLIIKDAKELLKSYNSPQWNTSDYPNKETFINDINNDSLYILKCEEIIGFIAILGHDSNYDYIDGSWLSNGDYISLHRLAIKKKYYHQRYSDLLIEFAINYAKEFKKSIRVDTHRLNIPMQKLLARHGFRLCGEITLNTQIDNKRLAYELII